MRQNARNRLPLPLVIAMAVLAGCAVPAPYAPPPPPPAPVPVQLPVEIVPPVEAPPPAPVVQPAPETPAPPPGRARTLNPAARSLVAQAQTQVAAGNHAVAAANLERALRIEPDSSQLWIEMGKVRQAEGNFAQAENMARKALSLATGDPRSQSAAWRLIAESYRSRKRAQEARDADVRAETLSPN